MGQGSIPNDTVGRILLDFYRAGQTLRRTPQPLGRVGGVSSGSRRRGAGSTQQPASRECANPIWCTPDIHVDPASVG